MITFVCISSIIKTIFQFVKKSFKPIEL